MQSGRETKSFWKHQGIIIAASPVIGYGLAFLYELGFYRVFKIPTEFITLDLTSVFIAAGSLVGIVLILYWIVDLFLILAPPRQSPLFRELASLLAISSLPIGLLVLWWGLWGRLIWVAAIFLFFVFFQFVFPLFTQRGKGSYIEKLQAQRKRDSEDMGVVDRLGRLMGWRTLLGVLIVVVLLFLSRCAGEAKALKQDEFLIPSTYAHSVVLRIYGENVICAPFDAEEKVIQKSFFIVRMTDEPRPMLQLSKVGPLRVKEK